MKHFLIKYRFATGSEEAWRQRIAKFIAAIEADPVLKDRISYRCTKANNASADYYHLAATADDEAAKALQERDFFKDYSAEMRRLSGESLEVMPLEILAEADFPLWSAPHASPSISAFSVATVEASASPSTRSGRKWRWKAVTTARVCRS